MNLDSLDLDPTLDLVMQRTVAVPPAKVWRAWTEPEQLKKWFCPRPWMTTECEIDLRPGGRFYTVMQGPAGEVNAGTGCYLEVVPEQRLVWTDFLLPGFRPAESGFMVGMILLEPDGAGGTRYTAIARHNTAASRDQHAAMGFEAGWGAALDQLVELAATW